MRSIIILMTLLTLNSCTNYINIFSDYKGFKIVKKEYNTEFSKTNGKYIYTIQSSFYFDLKKDNEYDNLKIISNKDFELGEELILTTSKMENLQ